MKTQSLPTNSHSIVRMKNPRLTYIKKLQAKTPTECPHCHGDLTVDDEQIYCPTCGLVTQDSYNYVAGIQFHLPHGLKLM